MADSEDDHDEREGVNLTGFLFGNIDESGRLESDILDSESQRQLSSLGRLGLGSFLSEMIGDNMSSQDNSDSDDDISNVNNNRSSQEHNVTINGEMESHGMCIL